jgi:hypothetical protein
MASVDYSLGSTASGIAGSGGCGGSSGKKPLGSCGGKASFNLSLAKSRTPSPLQDALKAGEFLFL